MRRAHTGTTKDPSVGPVDVQLVNDIRYTNCVDRRNQTGVRPRPIEGHAFQKPLLGLSIHRMSGCLHWLLHESFLLLSRFNLTGNLSTLLSSIFTDRDTLRLTNTEGNTKHGTNYGTMSMHHMISYGNMSLQTAPLPPDTRCLRPGHCSSSALRSSLRCPRHLGAETPAKRTQIETTFIPRYKGFMMFYDRYQGSTKKTVRCAYSTPKSTPCACI